jgi:hypothetical protein
VRGARNWDREASASLVCVATALLAGRKARAPRCKPAPTNWTAKLPLRLYISPPNTERAGRPALPVRGARNWDREASASLVCVATALLAGRKARAPSCKTSTNKLDREASASPVHIPTQHRAGQKARAPSCKTSTNNWTAKLPLRLYRSPPNTERARRPALPAASQHQQIKGNEIQLGLKSDSEIM